MENDRLTPHDEENYVPPQMSYCCGSKGVHLSPKFKTPRTRCIFVAMVFVIKLMEVSFVAFVLYDLLADSDHELGFSFYSSFLTIESVKPYNWILFVAAALVLIIYSSARCAGIGRNFCAALLLNILNTLGVAVFCGALITTDCVFPYRYIVFIIVASVCLVCLGICMLTTLFEMDVLGRGVFTALFMYFLGLFVFANFAYATQLRKRYGLDYLIFLQHTGIGGGSGLIIGMIMFWYVQELICGKVTSLNESEYLYVNLLI